MDALNQIKNRVEGHTEGPWVAKPYLYGSNERVRVTSPDDGPDFNTAEGVLPADAELIAAAPKLLAALEAVQALHYADEEVEGLYAQACTDGPCEHDDDCPEVTITPCYGCSTPGWNYVAWPCPTIKAIEAALR